MRWPWQPPRCVCGKPIRYYQGTDGFHDACEAVAALDQANRFAQRQDDRTRSNLHRAERRIAELERELAIEQAKVGALVRVAADAEVRVAVLTALTEGPPKTDG